MTSLREWHLSRIRRSLAIAAGAIADPPGTNALALCILETANALRMLVLVDDDERVKDVVVETLSLLQGAKKETPSAAEATEGARGEEPVTKTEG